MKMKCLIAAVLCASGFFAAEASRKKVIGCGWEFNTATVDACLASADEFDRTGLDGVTVWLRGKDANGNPVGMRNIYEEDWTYEMFAPMVPKLRKMAEHTAFRHNFLITFGAPRKRIAWTDDAAWARVAENLRVAACIARDGGCRGLLMDTEDYKGSHQFGRQGGDPVHSELCKVVRRRGAELFKGVFAEYPEAAILSYWFLSSGMERATARGVESAARKGGSLWSSFINGILDVMPPAARLIDGNETAYEYDADRNDYYRSAHSTRRTVLPLVAPENREKYRNQMQVSFGIYLDAYMNPAGSRWYLPPKSGSRTETFRRNLDQALDAADEYVWLYGEKRNFVKWPKYVSLGDRRMTRGRWEDEIPGFTDAVLSVKDPEEFARRRQIELESAGAWTNLVPNGNCAECQAGKVPKPFGTWRGEKELKDGTFGCDTSFGDGDGTSLCAEGVPNGCFVYTVPHVKAGDMYLVKCSASGSARVRIAWKTANGRYLQGTVALPFEKTEGPWRRGELALRVPVGAVGLQLTFGVSLAAGEKAWFDNIGVFPLIKYGEK